MKDYPTIDLSFIEAQIKSSPKIHHIVEAGGSKYYILKGSGPITNRSVLIRQSPDGQIPFHFATGCAQRLKFMQELLDWLAKNRKWKDGGYFV